MVPSPQTKNPSTVGAAGELNVRLAPSVAFPHDLIRVEVTF